MSPETPLPLPPVTALRTLARIGVFVRPYRRQVIYAAIALVVTTTLLHDALGTSMIGFIRP